MKAEKLWMGLFSLGMIWIINALSVQSSCRKGFDLQSVLQRRISSLLRPNSISAVAVLISLGAKLQLLLMEGT